MLNTKRKLLNVIFCLILLEYLSIFPFSLTNSYFKDFNHTISFNSDFNYLKSSLNGYINSEESEIFWFVHITDTQYIWDDQDEINIFYEFINETYQEIKPLFIIHTGDIVDAHNGRNQDINEWDKYNQSLTKFNLNSSIYIDLVGNHDGSNDPGYGHFLNYSMIGSEFNTTQISFSHSFEYGKYAFIGINTAKDSYDNFVDFSFSGYLNTQELDWYENELKRYRDYDTIFVFGHHPLIFPPYYKIISNLSSTGKTFFDLNKEYNVAYYCCGHLHSNYVQSNNGLFTIITDNFNEDNGTYRIVAIDNNMLSTSIENVGKWPQGIITSPSSKEFYNNRLKINSDKIHVLAWDPKGIISIKWRVCFEDNSVFKDWIPLKKSKNTDLLWEGDLYRDLRYGKDYIIKVNIEGYSGQTIKEMIYHVFINFTLIYLLLISVVVGIISLIILLIYYYRKRIINRNKQRNELLNP